MEREIEQLIAASQPVIGGILVRYQRTGTLMSAEDAEDLNSTIHLRLVVKLRAVAESADDAIRNLRGYVATVAYNVVNDHLRQRFPERARLKARLRYALTHEPDLALWPGEDGPLCGLSEWRGEEDRVRELPPGIAASHRNEAVPALRQIFHATQRPVLFDDAVDVIADAWNILDLDPVPLEDLGDRDGVTRAEDLDFARALWAEIRELPPMQRKALLLNLRYGGETNIISLLILGRIARFEEIAEALEMSRPELASIWRGLPIDDAAIAARLGITRQQVINLRKAARARLSRRLRR
jgi:RNA polymerase sigma factor (sigma-70 family)